MMVDFWVLKRSTALQTAVPALKTAESLTDFNMGCKSLMKERREVTISAVSK